MYTKIVSKISLSIFLTTTVILLVMLSTILVNTEGNYTHFIQSQAITQKNLQFAIIIAGLILISLTALTSWLISLYGSFRIAGPLYRFTQNLTNVSDTKKIIDIRSDDQLQELSKKIILAAEQIEQHKQILLTTIENIEESLKNPDTTHNKQQLTNLMQQLKLLDNKIKIDA